MGSINLTDVSFTYQQRLDKSLSGVNLEVKEGECIVLAGLSGSGKSTLIRLLAGLVPSFFSGDLQGGITVAGQPWQETELWEKAAMTGTVFQTPRNQFFCATVAQELVMAPENYGLTPLQIRTNMERAAGLMGVLPLLDRILTTLSSGEQQRVAMASTLCLDPRILLLDEPSANLSPDGVASLAAAVKEAKEAGKTIIIAEHRFRYLRKVLDRLIVLQQGEITYDGNPSPLGDQSQCRLMGLRYENLKKVVEETKEEAGNWIGKNTIVEIEGGAFRYKKKLPFIWQQMSSSFAPGEIIALTGTNGCGKTTLLSILFGLYKLTKGRLEKQDNTKTSLVLQQPEFQLFSSTVLEETGMSALDSPFKKEITNNWLEKFDLINLSRHHPLTLSGGESQRLVLAVAFSSGADLILLDEPTSGMDGYHLEKLCAYIRQAAKGGSTVIIATHDHDMIDMCRARVLTMDRTNPLNLQKCA